MTLFLERDIDSTLMKQNYQWRRIVCIEGEKEIGNSRRVEMKLLSGNGRETE